MHMVFHSLSLVGSRAAKPAGLKRVQQLSLKRSGIALERILTLCMCALRFSTICTSFGLPLCRMLDATRRQIEFIDMAVLSQFENQFIKSIQKILNAGGILTAARQLLVFQDTHGSGNSSSSSRRYRLSDMLLEAPVQSASCASLCKACLIGVRLILSCAESSSRIIQSLSIATSTILA